MTAAAAAALPAAARASKAGQHLSQEALLQLAFLEQPTFTFDLKLIGGDATLLPGVEDWLTALIRTCILKPFLLPERCAPRCADTALRCCSAHDTLRVCWPNLTCCHTTALLPVPCDPKATFGQVCCLPHLPCASCCPPLLTLSCVQADAQKGG